MFINANMAKKKADQFIKDQQIRRMVGNILQQIEMLSAEGRYHIEYITGHLTDIHAEKITSSLKKLGFQSEYSGDGISWGSNGPYIWVGWSDPKNTPSNPVESFPECSICRRNHGPGILHPCE